MAADKDGKKNPARAETSGEEQIEIPEAPKPEPAESKRSSKIDQVRDLERKNKELLVRVRELELKEIGDANQEDSPVGEEVEDISEEKRSIIDVVRALHKEIETADGLRDALEADLAAARQKIAADAKARTELDAKLELLEARAALADQLREDISFVEEELNTTAQQLQQATTQLAETSEERDRLEAEKTDTEKRLKDVTSNKISLDAQVLNYKERVAEMEQLRRELAELKDLRTLLEKNVFELKGNVSSVENSREKLESDLALARELIRTQKEEIAALKTDLGATRDKLSETQMQLERQQVDNVDLRETLKRAQRDIETLNAKTELMEKRLDSSKQALHDIRTAALRTATRVRKPAAEEG